MGNKSYLELETGLGYCFKNKLLLMNALTHSSYASDNNMEYIKNNERLEFVGDALLDSIIGIRLYNLLPKEREGKLTKIRAQVVCEETLKDIGNEIGLGSYLLIGKGEENTGGRTRKSIIANAVEAIIGAIFLDSDYNTVAKTVIGLFDNKIQLAINGKLTVDHKTKLQEILQKKYKENHISYDVVFTQGPDHDKIFHVELKNDGEIIGKGMGKSKKEAEQNAAQDALKRGVN